MKLSTEIKTNEFIIKSHDGVSLKVYEYKNQLRSSGCEDGKYMISKAPRYETDTDQQVIRLSENSFRVLSNDLIDKIFYIINQ